MADYIGWGPASLKKSLSKLRNGAGRKKVWKRLQKTQVLVIDEISMVENHIFERMNNVMKEARDDERPFGGVQVIVTGDVSTLVHLGQNPVLTPPVLSTSPGKALRNLYRLRY
jgi:ATP-dependent DNA helicase PIF1